MDERGTSFGSLHEVRQQRLAEEGRHGGGRDEVCRRHGRAVVRRPDDDAPEACLEVGATLRQRHDGHHLARRRDVEALLAGDSVSLSAEADHAVAQEPVV